jgi:hypothetical protein
MAKKQMIFRAKKVYGANTHYWNDDLRLLIIAILCVLNALEFSTKAKELYERIVEAWGKPSCIALIKGHFVLPVTEFIEWEKAVTNGKNYESKNVQYKAAIDKQVNDKDYQNLVLLVADFIKVGFNHKKGLKQYINKVSIENPNYIALAVQMISADDYANRHPNLEVEKEIKLGDKTIDPSPLYGVSQERTHRLHTKLLKKYGYNLNHDSKLRDTAWYWYQCRVVYSGIEDFCNRHFISTGIQLDPANINKEILLADKATGYPRKNLDNSIE